MTAPSKCCGPDKRDGFLPLDALYEILLRLPAKELCRLRAVCRPWRALLSDPRFIAAHAARHPGPLIVAGYHPLHWDSSSLFHIMDLSGQVLKLFPKMEVWQSNEWVISAQLDLVCITKGRSCILHNPATGSFFALPEGYAEEHSAETQDAHNCGHLIACGQVASTGQYKVLRVIDTFFYEQTLWLCEVFTLGSGSDARWRGKRAAPGDIDSRCRSRVSIKGPGPIRIASFDLGTEDWRPTLQGPAINSRSLMDLWFLMDFEEGLWVKQYSIQHKMSFEQDEFSVYPFLVLNDGRILTFIGIRGLLRIYDPRTSTYTDVADIGMRGDIVRHVTLTWAS
ncbi:hypothetical protein EJB05_14822, partial [Eragrostis curvula]